MDRLSIRICSHCSFARSTTRSSIAGFRTGLHEVRLAISHRRRHSEYGRRRIVRTDVRETRYTLPYDRTTPLATTTTRTRAGWPRPHRFGAPTSGTKTSGSMALCVPEARRSTSVRTGSRRASRSSSRPPSVAASHSTTRCCTVPPGLGKTTLASIIATEMSVSLRITSGPAIERAGDLVSILTNLKSGDVLFIDEIHRLNRVVEEVLYPALEDFAVDIVIGKGPAARSMRINLPRFTLVGATTRLALMTGPAARSLRFGAAARFLRHAEAMEEIIERSASILKVNISEEGAMAIAMRSRGTPRIANRLLKRVRDVAEVRGAPVIADGELPKRWKCSTSMSWGWMRSIAAFCGRSSRSSTAVRLGSIRFPQRPAKSRTRSWMSTSRI